MVLVYKTLARILAAISTIGMMSFSAQAETDLVGAGGTFPAPVYASWAAEYQGTTGNRINYQGIGSSGGIRQVIASTIDFGASDIPIGDNLLNDNELLQFPTIVGGVVLAVNIPGISPGEILLDGDTVSNIYLGNIKKWNNSAIIKLNPGLKLPDANINVVHRADGSGTSFAFTTYLSSVSREWQNRVGRGNSVNWPVGLGGKGNDGIAAFIQRLPGSIGYIEYAYARQSNLAYTKLVNANGIVVTPNKASFSEAAKQADWDLSLAQDLVNRDGTGVWPITSATFILVHKVQENAEKGREILKFFDWAYKNGSQAASELDYAFLTEDIIAKIYDSWNSIRDMNGQPIFINAHKTIS